MDKKAQNYDELVDNLPELLGGLDNISFMAHCHTRLRITIKNKAAVKEDEVKKQPGVVGVKWAGDQFQVVIGQNVSDVYQALCKRYGLQEGNSANEGSDGGKTRKISATLIFDYISGSITPLIPALMGCGFIKIIALLMGMAGLEGTSTYRVLTFVGDSAYYFLPILVGCCTARKFGANLALGMAVGAMFIHPDFISAINDGTALTIYGIPVYAGSYGSSLFPAFLTVAVMAPIQRFFAKHSPKTIRSIAEPLLTLMVIAPLGLCVLGPAGMYLGQYVSAAIIWLYETIGFLGVAVFACFCPLLVMTGMHNGLLPYMLQSFVDLGFEAIVLPGMIVSNLNQAAACFAVAFKTKKDVTLKSTATACGVTAFVGGITEPATYGITVPLKTPLYGAMIGSLVGGMIVGLAGSVANVMCNTAGIFGFTVFLPGGVHNILWLGIGVAVGMIITFVATLILYKEPNANEETEKTEKALMDIHIESEKAVVYQPVEGEVIPLEEINDGVFSAGIIGPGCGIRPTGGSVFAPINGVIATVADTKHAIGIVGEDGMEVLIHVGLDTVTMNGQGFSVRVHEGEQVKAGQELMTFDRDAIAEAGFSDTTAVLITNTADFEKVRLLRTGPGKVGEKLIQA